MMNERQYALPHFSEAWTKKGVPEHRGVWDGKSWSDVQSQIEAPEPTHWDRARRTRPTIWAHPEAFLHSLRRRARDGHLFQSDEFQLWAGLLAALYKGELEAERVELDSVDRDLPAAFREGLPFDPHRWPAAVASQHGERSITVYHHPDDARPTAVGYAPCVLAPSLWLWTAARDSEQAEKPALRFDDLIKRYADLEGYCQGLSQALATLTDATWPNAWFSKLLSQLRDAVGQFQQDELSPEALALLRTEAASPLGYCWGNDQPHTLTGEIWERYPLRMALSPANGSEDCLVFVADGGLDPALNPWLEGLAFPGSGDTTTRIRDLQLGTDNNVVSGRGSSFPLPAGHRAISLNPQAPRGSRLLHAEFVHLTGDGAALDDGVPLDGVHERVREAVARGHDATSLLPIDGEMLASYPTLARSLIDSFHVRSGVALPESSETVEVSLILPVRDQTEVVWQPNNAILHGHPDHDVVPSIDLWPDFVTDPPNAWALYLIRLREVRGRVRLRFPEVPASGQETWKGEDALVMVHSAPPTLVQLVDNSDPNNVHGTLVIDAARKLTPIMVDPQKRPAVAVDFGTTNTSVAVRSGPNDPPESLAFQQRTWPLLRPRAARPTPPVPGWVFDQSHHRGFFPTAIGAREQFKKDDPPCHALILDGAISQPLLERILNATELSGLKLKWLADFHDSPAIAGQWTFYDQLKWSTGEDNAFQQTLRACFMVHLFIHVAAEVQADTGAAPASWVFTHPLSMRWNHVEEYVDQITRALVRVQAVAQPTSDEPVVSRLDESRAIFRGFIQSWGKKHFPTGQRVVIADMGGGTVDFAVFGEHERRARLVRTDSLRLAGGHFFEFIGDVADDEGRENLAQALAIHFTPARSANVTNKIGGTDEAFRKAFNWTLVSSLSDKSGDDASMLASRLRQLTEERAPLRDSDHLAQWLSRLVRVVLGHAVLLGAAPIENGDEKISELEIVLAGNGWSLLPYCGYQAENEDDLSTVANRCLRVFGDVRQRYANALGGPTTIRVRTLERAVDRMPSGVYSKDLVALGALAPDGASTSTGTGENAIRASAGILGADLTLVSALEHQEEPPIAKVPWYATAHPDDARALLSAQRPAAGDSFFGQHTTSRGTWTLAGEPVHEGQGDAAVAFLVPEQLYMYALLDPGNDFPEGRSAAQVEDWNRELETRIEEWLRHVNAGATKTDFDPTSLIRGLWEYYFERQIRRHLSTQR